MPTTKSANWLAAVLPAAIFGVLRVIWALIENALTGWGDDQIANSLGIHSPTTKWVVEQLWNWGIPLLLLAGLLFAYHKVASRGAIGKQTPSSGLILPFSHEATSTGAGQNRRRSILTVSLIAVVIIIGLIVSAKVPKTAATTSVDASKEKYVPPRPLTLRYLFENDWPNLPSVYGTLSNSGRQVMDWRLNGDFDSRSKFFSVFLPLSTTTEAATTILLHFGDACDDAINRVDKLISLSGTAPGGSSPTYFRDMVFSKKIFVYYENFEFAEMRRAEIESAYSKHGLFVEFRDRRYALAHQDEPDWHISGPLLSPAVILPDLKGIKDYGIRFENLGSSGEQLHIVTRKNQMIMVSNDGS